MTKIDPIELSDAALELINVFGAASFSFLIFTRETLYTSEFRKYFDLILYHDASFIKVTNPSFIVFVNIGERHSIFTFVQQNGKKIIPFKLIGIFNDLPTTAVKEKTDVFLSS
ncbi:hypothetical protein BD770DRAFT_409567 [Pilaira anomala]|nr:hypothetical protein BD770DRAFT_409567 [Pilaira anomala]